MPSTIASFKTASSTPKFYTNTALDIFVVWYYSTIQEKDFSLAYICSINTNTNTINTFSMLPQFNVPSSLLYITSVKENFIVFYHFISGNSYQVLNEYIYQIDKISGLPVLVEMRNMPFNSDISYLRDCNIY